MVRLLVLMLIAGATQASPLSFAEATRAALERDPMLQRLEARGAALADDAVADGALPDPELMVGIGELPVDGFDVVSGEMRMYEVGIMQRFPPRGVRRSASRRGERLADAELLLAEARRLELVQAVARDWLDLLYLDEALAVVRETRTRFEEITDTVESRYAQGVGRRDDVIQVGIELMRVDEQESRLRQQIGSARAALALRIGPELAARTLESGQPDFAEPGDPVSLRSRLAEHPRARAFAARTDAGRHGEAAERARYRPQFGMSVGYMRRTGLRAGMEMPDAVSARVTVSVPLFTANRQDRRLAAAQARTWAADAERQSELYELEYQLERALSDHTELKAQRELYEQRLLPAAAEFTQTALNAYRAGSEDLLVLVRAQVAEYDVRLQYHEVILQLQRVRAELGYLAGENP